MKLRGSLNVHWIVPLIIFILLLIPIFLPSSGMLIPLTHFCIFSVLAMSYDILFGYTGIISFGHAMFFGIGAYMVGIFMQHHNDIAHLLVSFGAAVVITTILSLVVGMLSLRLKSHYYAMLTLAFSELFLVGAQKWRSFTKGEDGFTFAIPDFLTDKRTFYLITLIFMFLVYFLLRRFTQSPLGKVLVAIRENDKRTESLGYNVIYYKVIASVVSGVVAGLSGGFYALMLKFVNPNVFAVNVTLDVLLMTIIGGVGTLYGSIIGAAIIELAHNGLSSLSKVSWIFERWLIYFGIVYILVVMLFPSGIVGTVRQLWNKRKDKLSTGGRRHADYSFEIDQDR